MFDKTTIQVKITLLSWYPTPPKFNKFTHIKTYTPKMRPPKTTQTCSICTRWNQPTNQPFEMRTTVVRQSTAKQGYNDQ